MTSGFWLSSGHLGSHGDMRMLVERAGFLVHMVLRYPREDSSWLPTWDSQNRQNIATGLHALTRHQGLF